MGDEMLASVCELAFDVAKEGDAPSAMKNYLYLAQRPPRAYSVAERTLDEDATFRARVAERATIENVGEAGYLWLHRPAGWEQRVADINAGVESTPPATIQRLDDAGDAQRTPPSFMERPPMPAPPLDDEPTPSRLDDPLSAAAPSQPTPATQIPSPQAPPAPIPPALRTADTTPQTASSRVPSEGNRASAEPPIEGPRSTDPKPEPTQAPETMQPSEPTPSAPEPDRSARTSSTVNSIEDELSSLRGLVDRLADERQNVRSSVSDLEVELETRRAENLEMFSKLNSLRDELTSTQTSESTVQGDRDRALARIAELEADVARLTADVERMAAEADGQSSEHAAALTDLAQVTSERDSLKGELDASKEAHATSMADLTAVRTERQGLSEAATERDSLKGELDSLKAGSDLTQAQLESARSDLEAISTERDRIAGELEAVSTDRNSLTSQFNETRTERDQLRGKLESVTTERGELRSQLATAEAEGRELSERLTAMDQLRADNTELASRLSVAEQARVDLEGQLEDVSEKWKGATRQLSVFENVNNQLDSTATERDALQSQLVQANEALTQLQGRIGTSHDQIRNELTTIESSFRDNSEGLATTEPAAEAADSPSDEIVEATEPAEAEIVDAEIEPTDLDPTDLGASDSAASDSAASDFGAATLRSPVIDVPDFSEIDGLDAPAFNDGLDLDFEDVSPPSAETATPLGDEAAADNFFDGKGIELDPTVLGGRSMGDMFGSENEIPAVSDDIPSVPEFDNLSSFGSDLPEIADVPIAATSGRRRLNVSSELDESAFAKAVIASPDVVLLIDGDGAAGLGWPHLDVATRRGALVDYLGTLTANSGAAADVVFARPVGGEEALPVSRAVRVRIADAAVADSPIFSSIVNGYPEEWPIAIVTNEASLIAQAEGLGATVLTSDQLLDLFLDLNSDD